MEDCVFCKIIAGEIPSAKVFESDHVVAFLDVIPNTPGHVLVVPKEHSIDIFDTSESNLIAVMAAAKQVALMMKKNLGITGLNLANNNGEKAGQIVSHFHLHVIPRYQNDDLQMYGHRDHRKANPEELAAVAKKITA